MLSSDDYRVVLCSVVAFFFSSAASADVRHVFDASRLAPSNSLQKSNMNKNGKKNEKFQRLGENLKMFGGLACVLQPMHSLESHENARNATQRNNATTSVRDAIFSNPWMRQRKGFSH